MRNRSYDDRVAEVTRRRLEVLAAELGVDLDATSTEADTDPDPDPEAAPEPGAGAALAETRPGRHARRPVRPVRRVTLWIADRLPAGSGRRLDLGAAHVGLVALVLAGGLLLTAWLVLRSSPSGTAAPPRVSAPLAQSASSAPGSPGAGARRALGLADRCRPGHRRGGQGARPRDRRASARLAGGGRPRGGRRRPRGCRPERAQPGPAADGRGAGRGGATRRVPPVPFRAPGQRRPPRPW